MGGFSQDCIFNSTIALAASGGNLGVAPNAGASANTKGAWSQIVASSPIDCQMACLQFMGVASTTTVDGISVDIGIGAAASEVVLIPDVMNWYGATVGLFIAVNHVLIPLVIPAGTRISARAQANIASPGTTMQVNLILFDSGFGVPEGCAGVDAIGFTAASTTGTSITPGATGAKGSYAQLVASTSRDYCGFFFGLNYSSTAGNRIFDIAIGAAASEKIILPDLPAFNFYSTTRLPYFPVPVPAGQRLAARVADIKSGGNTTVSQLVAYGVYQ